MDLRSSSLTLVLEIPKTQIILPRLTSDFAQNIHEYSRWQGAKHHLDGQGCDSESGCRIQRLSVRLRKGVKLPAKTEAISSPTMLGLSLRRIAEHCSQTADGYMLVTTADTAKKPKIPFTKSLPNNKQKVPLPNRYREARQLDKEQKKATQSPNTIMAV